MLTYNFLCYIAKEIIIYIKIKQLKDGIITKENTRVLLNIQEHYAFFGFPRPKSYK